jgi:NtrC-family two-component system sensor histidine kinase KinB
VTLRTKIRAGYVGTGLIVSVAVLWSVSSLRHMSTATDAILRENYRSILAADNMILALERQDSGLLLALLGLGGAGERELARGASDFAEWQAAAAGNVTLPGEADVISDLHGEYVTFSLSAERVLRLQGRDAGEATRVYEAQTMPLFRSVQATAIRLREINQDAMVDASDRAIAVGHDAIVTTVVLGLVLFLAASVGGETLTRRILRPMSMLSAAADELAAGNYDVSVPEATRDEVGHLSRRFGIMARQLKGYQEMNIGRILAEKRRGDSMVACLADGVVLLDRASRVVRINPRASEVLDVDATTAVGQALSEILEDREVLERIGASGQTVASPCPKEDLVLDVHRDGRAAHFRVIVTPIEGGPPEESGSVLLLQDITQFRELDRLKTEFVATASHELRTPLTSLAMSLDLLRERVLPGMRTGDGALLRAAIEDTNRMRLLVDDLLDLSRIESGHTAIQAERVSLEPVILNAVAAIRSQAEAAGVTVETDCTVDAPEAFADPTRIGWVLTNLLGNALKYGGPNTRVRVTLEGIADHVQISVADDGPGIAVDMQSRIFGTFVQGREGVALGGSGLGLAIAKAIVEAHGGSIWVDSAPGRGSTFTFILPRADRPESDLEEDTHG